MTESCAKQTGYDVEPVMIAGVKAGAGHADGQEEAESPEARVGGQQAKGHPETTRDVSAGEAPA